MALSADYNLEITRQPLDESIADHLRGMIVRGEIAPGERLRLTDLARELEVSTTPLREALKILAEEQTSVEWLPGRGPRVAPIRIRGNHCAVRGDRLAGRSCGGARGARNPGARA